MKKIIIIVLSIALTVVLLIILAGIYKFNYLQDDLYIVEKNGQTIKLNDYDQKFIDIAKNGTYLIDGELVTLVDGRAETEIAPDSASKDVTKYSDQYIVTDINNDGIQDIAFFLSQESGGSGTFYYVAAQMSSAEGYQGSDAFFIGDRIKPKDLYIDGENTNNIIAFYSDRKPGESLSANPTVDMNKKVEFQLTEKVSSVPGSAQEINQEIIDYVRTQQKIALQGKDINLKERLKISPNSRTLFLAQYPEFSNSKTQEVIDHFLIAVVEDFKKIVKEQEKDFEEYKDEVGGFPASFVTQKTISFEVPHLSEKLKIIRFIIGESTGGSGSEENAVFVFDEQGNWMNPKDAFIDPETALNTVAKRAKEDIVSRLGEDNLFLKGLAPTYKNYQNIAFDDTGNLIIYFDKYQVAAGSNGLVTVEIAHSDIKELLKPKFLKFFHQ